METLTKAYNFVVTNIKLVGIIIAAIVVSIVGVIIHLKSKKIFKLQNELYLQQAKLSVQKAVAKYEVKMGDLGDLRREEKDLDKKLKEIEESLKTKLSDSMTGDEIVEAFKKYGIPKCD